jgi:hypothetical protein
MSSTALFLVQTYCQKQGLPVPTALVGTQEKSVRQFLGMMNDLVLELSEFKWQGQKIVKTWTALAAQDQGPLTTIFGAGYGALVPNTLWNQTRRMRVFGPLPDTIWQALQVLPNAGPECQSWISGGNLFISPAPEVTDTLSAVYSTSYGVVDNSSTAKPYITEDTDTFVFPDIVMLRGLEYKWKKTKGQPGWEDDYNTFIGLVAKNMVKDGAPEVSLDTPSQSPRPGIIVPAGSWNVSGP